MARAGKNSRGFEVYRALEVCARWPEGLLMGWSLGKEKGGGVQGNLRFGASTPAGLDGRLATHLPSSPWRSSPPFPTDTGCAYPVETA